MGFGSFLKKTVLPAAGAAVGAYFGGPTGAGIGYSAGSMLGGGSDDETSALDVYNLQRSNAISDWNRQNAYNDPKAQMARLEASGLNPYLVYSSGNVTGNSSSAIDNVQYSSNGVYNPQLASSELTKYFQELSLRSMKADTKGKEVDTEMRELDLQLKKARLAKYLTGGSTNKVDNPDKVNSGSLGNVNTYLDLFDKFGDWAKKRHIDQLDKRVFQYLLGDDTAFTKDYE